MIIEIECKLIRSIFDGSLNVLFSKLLELSKFYHRICVLNFKLVLLVTNCENL